MKFLRANWFPFVLWIEVSLVAIAFVGDRPYLGLTIAVLGGVVLGWVGIASAGEQAVQAKVGTKETGDTATGLGAKAKGMTRWIAAHELWFLAVPLALLIFPNPAAPLALIGVALLWPIRWVARRRITVPTPVDVHVLGLLVMMPLALYASVDLAMSRIILYQILAGVALFYGLVNALRSERDVWRMAFLLVLGGVGLALIAPFGTAWRGSKLFNLPPILLRVPRLLPDAMHHNVLAGALVLIIPIGISLIRTNRSQTRLESHKQPPGHQDTRFFKSFFRAFVPLWLDPCRRIYKLALALALMLAITALTQSRGGYMALAAGMLLFAIVVNRWFLVLGLAAGLGLAAAVRFVGIETLAELLLTTDAVGGWAVRQEVWSRAIYMIQDLPYTGGGLGTFGRVVPVMYPYFLAGPDADVPHAHNLFLQVAADLGLPGLVAFVGLFSGSLIAAWRAYSAYRARKEAGPQALALGLLISLVIMGLHGLTDAVTWGTKPAIVPWCVMGLAVGLYGISVKGEASSVRHER